MANHEVRFIAPKAVQGKTSLSPREQKRREAAGRFPRAVKLGSGPNGGRIGYIEAEIDAWCADQVAQRDRQAEPASAAVEAAPAAERYSDRSAAKAKAAAPVPHPRGRPRRDAAHGDRVAPSVSARPPGTD